MSAQAPEPPAERLCDIAHATPVLRVACATCLRSDDHGVRELMRFYGYDAVISDVVAALRLECGHGAETTRSWRVCSAAQPSSSRLDEETAIDEALAEFNGDARATIAALLHDIDALAADARAAMSPGYRRGGDFIAWRRRVGTTK
ncbi:hypothetical protein [Terrarubrum flagellatum]|uniref:hypothetical protein n=1 Tax=Terrirubrum flagellatum TaxID=2895980 RepID=UPI00314539B3